MSLELLYTSSPKGLQTGSRGFCTVACTQGMPTPLIEKVESLSGYRPLFPPSDAKALQNPIAWSHVRLLLGGKSYSVLSRVCFAGLDYTDRTNKFAHHVLLEAHELPAGGPAWLLRQPAFLESRWDGQVRWIPSGRAVPRGDQPPAVCKEWQRLTGDAGWAGAVAESFLKNPDRPVYFLFEPGMDLLPLVAEALALLPPDQRWNVGFSTYMTGLPTGMTCPWRGVPRASEDAATARRLPGALVIDLCDQASKAVGGPLVEAARTGRAPARLDTAAAVAVPMPPVPAAAIVRPSGSAQGLKPGLPPPPMPYMPASAPTAPAGSMPRSGFWPGVASGLLGSLIPLVALVLMGVVILAPFPELSLKGSSAQQVAVLPTTEKAPPLPELPVPKGDEEELRRMLSDRETTLSKMKKEYDDKLDGKNATIEQLTNERNQRDGEISNLKSQLKSAEAKLNPKETAKTGNDKPIPTQADIEKRVSDARKEGEKTAKDNYDKQLEQMQKNAAQQDKLGLPKNIVECQFDCLKENTSLNIKLPESEKYTLSICSMENSRDTAKEFPIPFRVKQDSRESNTLKLHADYRNKDGAQSIEIVKIILDPKSRGRLSCKWEKPKDQKNPTLEDQAVAALINYYRAVLPNQLLEAKPEKGKPFVFGLREPQVVPMPADGSISLTDLSGKIDKITGLRTVWRTWSWDLENPPKGLPLYRPRDGARVYMVVDKWLVEIYQVRIAAK